VSHPINPWATPGHNQQPPLQPPPLQQPSLQQPYAAQQYPPPAYGPPPGYGPPPIYPKGPAYARSGGSLQTNRGLATALLVLGGIYAGYGLLRALLRQAALTGLANSLQFGTPRGAAYTLYTASGILGLVTVPLWIVGSIWLYRAHSNAHLVAPAQMHRKTVWSWLGWIVPIVAWWFPKQIVDDSWRATADPANPASPGRCRNTGAWWGLWLAYNVLSYFTTLHNGVAFGPDPQTLPSGTGQYATPSGASSGLHVIVALIGVAAFVAWVPIVRGLTQAQDDLIARAHLTGWARY
jgi:Domain of unknown function (DUF4328)